VEGPVDAFAARSAIAMRAPRRRSDSASAVEGIGAYIDMSQTETGLMLTGTSVREHQLTGKPTQRYGNRMPYRDWTPHGAFRCAGDDNWIAISIQSDEQWRALGAEMGSPSWALDYRFASITGLRRYEDELEAKLTEFTREGLHRSVFGSD